MKFKKIGKIATLAVTFGVAGAVGFGSVAPFNNSLVYAATSYSAVSSVGDQISLTNVKRQYSTEDIKTDEATNKGYILLATPTVLGSSTISVSATNSSGKTVTVTEGADGWRLYLSNDKGVYYVNYKATNASGVVTASQNMTVAVDSIAPSFVWESNTKQIIPSKINQGKSFNIPFPSLTDDEGEYLKYDDGSGVDKDLTADFIASLKDETKFNSIGLKISLKNANNANVTSDCLSYDATTGLYKLTLPNDAKVGKWTLTYVYSASNSYTITKTFQFQVVSTTYFNPEENVALKFSGFKDSKSIPTSMELNVASEFPYANIVNTKDGNASIDVYQVLKLTCKYGDGATQQTTTYTTEQNPEMFDGFKFTPTVAGDYTVEYIVYDAYGNQLSHMFDTIMGVKKGTTGTKVYVVEEYTENLDAVKALKSDDLEDAFYGDSPVLVKADYMVPTKVKTGTIVTLPAIYAIDLTDGFDSLTFSRVITNKTTGSTVTYNLSQSSEERKVAPNKTINYEFSTAGEYSIRYQVKDSASGTSTVYYDTFTVMVEDDFEDTTNPTADFVGLSKTIIAGNSFTFSLDVNDLKSGSTTEYDDTNLKQIVTYSIGTAVENKTIYPNEDGVYTIEVPEGTANDTEVTILLTVTDDAGNVGTKTGTVIVKNYSTDTTAPIVATDFDFEVDDENSCWHGSSLDGTTLTLVTKQKGDYVTLPRITFSDADSNNLVVSAFVENVPTGNLTKTFSGMSGSLNAVTMGGADSEKFQLPYAGKYRVTYVATDANNNVRLYSFEFEAISNTPASIYGVGNISSNVEYGDEIDVVSGITIYDNDTIQTGYSTKFLNASEYANIENTLTLAANNTLLVYIDGAYTPKQADENKIVAGNGSITIYYWAKNSAGLWSSAPQVQTISATDSTAPTFYVDESKMETVHDYDKTANASSSLVNYVFIADMESLNDSGIGVDLSSKQIVAKYSDTSTELKIGKIEDIDVALFDGENDAEKEANKQWYVDNYMGYVVATKNGTINITYSLSDKNGNAAQTKTVAIACGDITPPTISISDVPFATNYKINDTLTIDLTKTSVSDDSDEEDSSVDYNDVTVVVTCDGTTVSKHSSSTDTNLVYSISKAGNYVVTFTVTDKAGNQTSTTKEFTVNANTVAPTVSTTVWGTILIILALLVLGGVIYFFVKPSKSKGAKKKEEKKEPEKKIEV